MTLEVVGLDAWYGPAQILFGVSLTVGEGEVVALVGRNGAGKSTTMRALMSLVDRRAERLSYRGRDLSRLRTHEMSAAGLGYVPEDRRIFTELTVDENLEVGRRPAPPGVAAWTPARLFELFPSLATMRARPGGQMSGGEQQMLAIARTLMGNPSLVLLDEPSEGLAPLVVEQMADAVRTMKAAGIAILLSEQNSAFSRSIADREVAMERGQIVG